MHRSGLLYSAVVRSLPLVLAFAGFVYCSGSTIPDFCLKARPRSSEDSCGNQSRRFFFHYQKLMCKPFGICKQDADSYDLETGLNFFQSMEDCDRICPGAVECPTPEPIQNGVYSNGSYGLNDTITYSCSEGYELIGSPNRTCQLDNSWQGTEPRCQEQCKAPGPVENAVLSSVKTHYSVGSKIIYTCNQSYVGGGERICQLDGTWTGPNVTCQYVECPPVEAITNGVVTEHSRELASNVSYSCLAGYELIGVSVRTCQVNGSWTGSAPHCQAQCPAPLPVVNAVISPQRDYHSIGSRIQYTCHEGYAGDTERECQADASWSGPQPNCEMLQIECPDPVPIDNGDVRAPDLLRVGAKLVYSCNAIYSLIGNSTRTCTETGEWSGSKPVCARIRLLYGDNREDVTNSTLSLPSGEDEHVILCMTEPATYPGRIAPVWSVVGSDDLPHSVSADGVRLIFRSVFKSREQEAEYMCTSGAQTATVDITVSTPNEGSCQEPPELGVQPDTKCVHEGEMVQFSCVLTGCPPPEVRWYHNGTLVEESPTKRSVNSIPLAQYTVCTLSIADISATDMGSYQCFGNNTVGSTQSQIVQLKTHGSVNKRSVQPDTRQVKSPLCREDQNAVMVVGQVRRSSPKAAALNHPTYRIRVNKVLRGAEAISRARKLMTVVLPPTQNPTHRLQQDTTYIITGINIDNKLIFADHNSIQTHSNELEDLIQAC